MAELEQVDARGPVIAAVWPFGEDTTGSLEKGLGNLFNKNERSDSQQGKRGRIRRMETHEMAGWMKSSCPSSRVGME